MGGIDMREMHKEMVMRQYYKVITDLIAECESLYRQNRPYCELEKRIGQLILSAKRDGLDEVAIIEMVTTKLPDYFEKTAVCSIAA